MLFAYGVVKVWDTELYNILVGAYKKQRMISYEFNAYMTRPAEAAQSGDYSKLLAAVAFSLTAMGGWVAVLVWMITGWGAYRELTGLSKQKSFLAGMIFCPLILVALTFLYFLHFALI